MRVVASLLGSLPPEVAHRTAIRAINAFPLRLSPEPDARLRLQAFGMNFANPLGLAAGFDKSAEAVEGLGRLGFGFIEVGTLTPRPQIGNPKPRLFRLPSDFAIVNRMGFNNDGYAHGRERLADATRRGIVGVNIGPNKDSPDRIADFVNGVETFAPVVDYFTINISSPNTPGLRNLQARAELARLLDGVLAARANAAAWRPILLKIAPDLSDDQLEDVLDIALDRRIDGLVVANTSIHRPRTLTSRLARESGGLSGRPIFSLSTRLLAQCFLRCGDALPIVGVGGVEDAPTAITKFEAGARLVQIYTALIYRGPGLIGEILRGLTSEVERRGLTSLSALIGTRAHEIAVGSPP